MKRIICILFPVLFLAGNYALKNDVLSAGGRKRASANYVLQGSISQTTIGKVKDTDYKGTIGFWHWIDAPPLSPYIMVKKEKPDDVVISWTPVITDTLGNPDTAHYYIVYRDTFPSFIPDSLDSIGIVFHPETTYTDSNALTTEENYYHFVIAVDLSGNKSKKSNMGYVFRKFLNENPGATADRNWVSLPYHSEYDSIKDLTDDLSPSGDPISKITRLDVESQNYYSWIYHPVGFWYGNGTPANFPIVAGQGYEMTAETDSTVIFVGANDPDGLITLNENPGATADRNWISIPYNGAYSTVSDVTSELSPSGDPVNKITMLDEESQMFYSWFYHPLLGWLGNHPVTPDFPIVPGTGYEFIAVKDTTWNPTEYSNEESGTKIVKRRAEKSEAEIRIGASLEPERTPAWLDRETFDGLVTNRLNSAGDYYNADFYRASSEHDGRNDGVNMSDDREACISHIVYADLKLNDFEGLVFTAYRPHIPYDVLTENSVSCVVVRYGSNLLVSFDVVNFKKPLKDGEEVILIVEATKNGKAYFTIVNFNLDKRLDIQNLGELSLVPIPNPEVSEGVVNWNVIDNDNIIGYSLYENGERLNEKVLQSDCSVSGDVSLRLVVSGGHETIYSSQGTQDRQDTHKPISFAFNISPNPFVKQTRIDYALPNMASVEIVIYDVSGRKVTKLVSETQKPGYYTNVWNGTDDIGRKLSSGIYFVKFEAGEFRAQDKILLVK